MISSYHLAGKQGLPGNLFEVDKPYYKHDWQWYYPKLLGMIPDKSSILDIGAGRGGFAQYLKNEKQCGVTALDMSPGAIKLCKDKGIFTLQKDIENEEIKGVWDIILMTAVLEHLINPRHVLWKLRNNITNGGFIILAQSNFLDILSRLRYLIGYGAKYYEEPATKLDKGVAPCAHLHLFDKNTLARILQLEGYKPVTWAYASQPYSEAKNPALPWWRHLAAWLYHYSYEKISNPLFSEIIIVKAQKI